MQQKMKLECAHILRLCLCDIAIQQPFLWVCSSCFVMRSSSSQQSYKSSFYNKPSYSERHSQSRFHMTNNDIFQISLFRLSADCTCFLTWTLFSVSNINMFEHFEKSANQRTNAKIQSAFQCTLHTYNSLLCSLFHNISSDFLIGQSSAHTLVNR